MTHTNVSTQHHVTIKSFCYLSLIKQHKLCEFARCNKIIRSSSIQCRGNKMILHNVVTHKLRKWEIDNDAKDKLLHFASDFDDIERRLLIIRHKRSAICLENLLNNLKKFELTSIERFQVYSFIICEFFYKNKFFIHK
jgi:hypothetical protein